MGKDSEQRNNISEKKWQKEETSEVERVNYLDNTKKYGRPKTLRVNENMSQVEHFGSQDNSPWSREPERKIAGKKQNKQKRKNMPKLTKT